MARKSWEEKFNAGGRSEVKIAPKNFADIKAGQLMLLTTPKAVDAFIRDIPAGSSMTIKEMRAGLAAAAQADIACPVVTGIHLRTVAEIANAQLEAGIPDCEVTPVWRVIEPGAPITKKLERGVRQFMQLRRLEGLSFR